MRFGLKDLLLSSALLSLYLGVYSSVTGEGGQVALVTIAGVCCVVAFIAYAMNWLYRAVRIGRVLVRLRYPRPWMAHAVVATITLGLILLIELGMRRSPLSVYLTFSGLAVHLHLLLNTDATIGERGMLVEGRYRSWRRCRFEIVSHQGGDYLVVVPPWYARTQQLLLPPDSVERVREVLAAKQGSEQQPPMNTDQPG